MRAETATGAIAVRRAGPLDAALAAALHAGSFTRAWDEASMAQFLAAPSCLCLIASSTTGIAPQGFLIVRTAGDEAELLTLAVEPQCRRKGIATALLGEAVRASRAAGAKRMFLEVDDGNAPALQLYESMGAVRVGKREAYYEHGAHASIFCLAL